MEMTNLQACIFDLDGVIVDTAKYHYLAWKRLANEHGFDFTEEDNERLKGVSRMRSLDILLEIGGLTVSDDEKEAMAARKNDWYVEYIAKMDASEILPGVQDFLAELKDKGIRTALGSASKNARLILGNVGLLEAFDAIIDGTLTSQAKPDPEVFLLGAQALSVTPESCLVFEDAEAGIEAAKRAGMRCVGVGESDTLAKADVRIKGFEGVRLESLLA